MIDLGIRSTRYLTREDAEYLYKEFRIKQEFDKKIKCELIYLDDKQLGDKLDELTDDEFSNYLVGVDEDEEEW